MLLLLFICKYFTQNTSILFNLLLYELQSSFGMPSGLTHGEQMSEFDIPSIPKEA